MRPTPKLPSKFLDEHRFIRLGRLQNCGATDVDRPLRGHTGMFGAFICAPMLIAALTIYQ